MLLGNLAICIRDTGSIYHREFKLNVYMGRTQKLYVVLRLESISAFFVKPKHVCVTNKRTACAALNHDSAGNGVVISADDAHKKAVPHHRIISRSDLDVSVGWVVNHKRINDPWQIGNLTKNRVIHVLA